MPTELWLVRHGARLDYARPTWRKEIVSNGGDVRDPPLSPLGHRQARMVAEDYFLRLPEGARPQRILVSPYLRVITTAAPTADALGLALELELGLAETHYVPDRLPSAAQRFRYLPMVDPASGGAASLMRPAATPGHYVEALGMARQDHAEESYFVNRIKIRVFGASDQWKMSVSNVADKYTLGLSSGASKALSIRTTPALTNAAGSHCSSASFLTADDPESSRCS